MVCQNWIGMGVKKEKMGEGAKDTANTHTRIEGTFILTAREAKVLNDTLTSNLSSQRLVEESCI